MEEQPCIANAKPPTLAALVVQLYSPLFHSLPFQCGRLRNPQWGLVSNKSLDVLYLTLLLLPHLLLVHPHVLHHVVPLAEPFVTTVAVRALVRLPAVADLEVAVERAGVVTLLAADFTLYHRCTGAILNVRDRENVGILWEMSGQNFTFYPLLPHELSRYCPSPQFLAILPNYFPTYFQ